LLDAVHGRINDISGEVVWQLAAEGDSDALGVVDEFCWWVALGLANLTNAFDPAMIVLGGGLVRAADLYLDRIRHSFNELLYSPELRSHPELVVAQFGEFAGAVGAAVLGGSSRHRQEAPSGP
jgi:glucokinase